MGRTVVTAQDVERDATAATAKGNASPATPDDYTDRLLKYIPADVIAIYLALLKLFKTTPPQGVSLIAVEWVVFIAILVLSVPWQWYVAKIHKPSQIWIGTGAFFFWALTNGDPFDTSWQPWYQPVYGTALMMLYTFLIPRYQAQR